MNAVANPQFQALTLLLQLEREARHAPDEEALALLAVNRTRTLLEYHQAALLRRGDDGGLRVVALSNVAVVERNAPAVRWLEAVAKRLDAAAPRPVTAADLDGEEAAEWSEWCPAHGLLCPLVTPDGRRLGTLWLTRTKPWQEPELVLVERLVDGYAHAWGALGARRRRPLLARPRPLALLAAAAAAVALLLPLRQSALAPAEVVAHDPLVVSAPIDGVIASFDVQPNQAVAAGQPLFRFEDATLRAAYEVAEKALAVAEAEYLQASQGAFLDPASKAKLGALKAQIELRTAERDYARDQLDRTVVKADGPGVALFTDPNDWIGKPVTVGERILQLADPAATELRVHLPVADAIVVQEGAEVVLFLDIDPLTPRRATLTYASYEAENLPGGLLAYRVNAAFDRGGEPPRLGLQGTAKLYGDRAPLAYHLLRRPLAALRRWAGL